MDDLAALTAVVRRVIGAKVPQPHMVEDLTQETLLRIATTDRDMEPDERQAYAIVTARNLVTDHARRVAVHDRHLHRLIDSDDQPGPEQVTLQHEETTALAEALQQLPPGDRTLLMRHEVDGVSVDALAAETRFTPRALANRLARARATLRVDFLVAFRHIALPTAACRPILLALASGDRRRQHQLHADRHLDHCPVCADLAQPVTQRRRGIAALLPLPLADALRRPGRSLRQNHWTQAAAATVIFAGLVTAFAVTRAVDPSERTQPATPSTTLDAISARSPAPAPQPPPANPATPPPATVQTPPSCPPATPLDQPPPPPLGCPIAPTTFTVTDVPADEGFWAQDATGTAIWIQLIGSGESPFDVTAGSTVTASGTLTAPAGDPSIVTDQRTIARGSILIVAFENLTPS